MVLWPWTLLPRTSAKVHARRKGLPKKERWQGKTQRTNPMAQRPDTWVQTIGSGCIPLPSRPQGVSPLAPRPTRAVAPSRCRPVARTPDLSAGVAPHRFGGGTSHEDQRGGAASASGGGGAVVGAPASLSAGRDGEQGESGVDLDRRCLEGTLQITRHSSVSKPVASSLQFHPIPEVGDPVFSGVWYTH